MCHFTGVYRVRNANARLLLPGHWPSAWRLEHQGHQQTARLGGLSARRSEHPGSQQTARLGGLSASRFEHLDPQQTARLGGLPGRVPFAP